MVNLDMVEKWMLNSQAIILMEKLLTPLLSVTSLATRYVLSSGVESLLLFRVQLLTVDLKI
jgi:hypothetical protein